MRYLVAFLLLFNAAYAAETPGQDYVVATIGEDKICYSEIIQAAGRLSQHQKDSFDSDREWKINFIREYAARFAAAKKAVAEGLDKDKEVNFDIEQARRSILAERMISRDLARMSYTEQDVKNYYEQNKARYRDKERVKVSYIKVKTKDEADKMAARLDKGEKFEKAGKDKIVKYTNWVQIDTPMFGPELINMPPQSLRGIFMLDVGGHSQPVEHKDKGEYYIFRIDEKIEAKDLPYEQVRQQVEFEYAKMLKDRTVKAFIRDIFAKEKVVINEADIK